MNIDIKIGFVSIDSPLDKRSWSGINHMIYNSLKSRFPSIELLSPLNNFGLKKILSLINWLSFRIFKKKYNHGHSYLISKLYSYVLNKKISNKEFDLLIVVVSSPALAFLRNDAKVIYITDATFKSLIDYYIYNLWKFSIRESNYIEQLALQKSTRVVLPSEWAQKEVFKNYGVPYDKSRVFFFRF